MIPRLYQNKIEAHLARRLHRRTIISISSISTRIISSSSSSSMITVTIIITTAYPRASHVVFTSAQAVAAFNSNVSTTFDYR